MGFTPKTTKERIHHRLKISLGHLKKVINMVEKDEYCIDILHQSQAVQKALREVNDLILENHLRTCTAEAIKKGDSNQAIAEIMQVLDKRQT